MNRTHRRAERNVFFFKCKLYIMQSSRMVLPALKREDAALRDEALSVSYKTACS